VRVGCCSVNTPTYTSLPFTQAISQGASILTEVTFAYKNSTCGGSQTLTTKTNGTRAKWEG